VKKNFKFPICYLTIEEIKTNNFKSTKRQDYYLLEYHKIQDNFSSLEKLRQYQLQHLLGRYKVF